LGFDAGDSNLYRYVNNRPTIEVDPSGLGAAPAMQPPAPPTGPKFKLFHGPNPSGTPVPGPSGWSVINALGQVILFNAQQAKAINDWAVADQKYHESYLNELDPADLPANKPLRRLFENPNFANLQAVNANTEAAIQGTCGTPKGVQGFVWQNGATGNLKVKGYDNGTDRIILAFAHLDNTKIGRATSGGSPATRRATLWARSVGKPDDDAGHAIGFQFGGSGRKASGNIFPQNPYANQRIQGGIERTISNFAKKNPDGCVTILLTFYYENPKLPQRPTAVRYSYVLGDKTGATVSAAITINNP
jgi:hypothetical protein